MFKVIDIGNLTSRLFQVEGREYLMNCVKASSHGNDVVVEMVPERGGTGKWYSFRDAAEKFRVVNSGLDAATSDPNVSLYDYLEGEYKNLIGQWPRNVVERKAALESIVSGRARIGGSPWTISAGRFLGLRGALDSLGAQATDEEVFDRLKRDLESDHQLWLPVKDQKAPEYRIVLHGNPTAGRSGIYGELARAYAAFLTSGNKEGGFEPYAERAAELRWATVIGEEPVFRRLSGSSASGAGRITCQISNEEAVGNTSAPVVPSKLTFGRFFGGSRSTTVAANLEVRHTLVREQKGMEFELSFRFNARSRPGDAIKERMLRIRASFDGIALSTQDLGQVVQKHLSRAALDTKWGLDKFFFSHVLLPGTPSNANEILVEIGDSLEKALSTIKNDQIIRLRAGNYFCAKPLKIQTSVVIEGAGIDHTKILCENPGCVVCITEDGFLTAKNLTFEHRGGNGANIVHLLGNGTFSRCCFRGGRRNQKVPEVPGCGIWKIGNLHSHDQCDFKDNEGKDLDSPTSGLGPKTDELAPKPTPAAPKPTPAAPKPTPAAPKPTPAAPKPTPAAPKPNGLQFDLLVKALVFLAAACLIVCIVVLSRRNSTSIEVETLEHAVTKDPNDLKAINSLSGIYLRRGRIDRIELMLDKVAKNPKVSADTICTVIDIYARLEDKRVPEPLFNRLVDVSTNKADALYKVADIESQLGSKTEASNALLRAFKSNITNGIIVSNLFDEASHNSRLSGFLKAPAFDEFVPTTNSAGPSH